MVKNNLLQLRPDLAIQWDYERNYPLRPEDVTLGSNKKVWWILPYDDPRTGKHFDFTWEAPVYDRAKKGTKSNEKNRPMTSCGE